MAESHNRVKQVFAEAMQQPKGERASFIERVCAGDAALLAEVTMLVEAMTDAAEAGFLSTPTVATPSSTETLQSPVSEGPGTRIGPYKILQMIGEGGFGSVFMAEQSQPVQRRVALKIIKLGMDTKQVIARFEAERQALAMMDHPNIARVLDAGATDAGRPYFVMELVKGDPITDYCDKNNLNIEDRLELFAQVCNAVQHAHQKGIIHRDLKPSNILVSTQDGRPNAKVIDFGIAKATASKLTEKTLFTEHRQLIGTPEYMSPEQAEGSMDIDTRTDVYSLGVLLYELLTGTTPFDGEKLRSAAYGEMQRMIREVDPPKPSTKLSQSVGTIANVAARRRTEPRKLNSIIRGELDWIVMKALEKDRQRRYETANGLAADIQRYLAGDAVVAAPPSTAYRFNKFIKRNKGVVVAGSLVAASLLIGLVAFAWQAKIAREQRDIAVAAQQAEAEQRKAAEAARAEAVAQQTKAEAQEVEAKKQEAEAKKQAAIAEAVAKFQTDMLAAVDPANLPKDPATGEPLKDKVTVVQAIEAAVKKLDADGGGEGALKEQPLVEAEVRSTIGITLRALARYDDAEANHRKALAIRRAALPAGHQDIAISLNNIAVVLQAQNKLAEAEPLAREALEIYRVALPAGHTEIATGLNNLAVVLQAQNKLAEAEPLFREALEIRRAALPAGHTEIATGLNNLAQLLLAENKLAEAEPVFREALAMRRAALPAGHPAIATGLNNLATLLLKQNKFAEAEPLFREALEIRRAALPAGHPGIANGLNNLAEFLLAQNKFAEAEPLIRELLAIRRATLPAGHPDIAAGLVNLAHTQQALGQTAEARAGWDEAIAMHREGSPKGSPLLAHVLWRSGSMRLESKDAAAALPELEEALSMAEKTLPADHPQLKEYRETLATCKEVIEAQKGK